MKEIFKPLFILLAAISMTSCTDMLDIKPTTFVSDDLIWQDKKLIDQFVANTYGTLVCGFNRNTQGWDQDWAAAFGGNFDAGADDFDGKFDANVNQFNTGQITAQSTPFIDEIWKSNYSIIRKCKPDNCRRSGHQRRGADTDRKEILRSGSTFPAGILLLRPCQDIRTGTVDYGSSATGRQSAGTGHRFRRIDKLHCHRER